MNSFDYKSNADHQANLPTRVHVLIQFLFPIATLVINPTLLTALPTVKQ
jgi:hypothetical protein